MGGFQAAVSTHDSVVTRLVLLRPDARKAYSAARLGVLGWVYSAGCAVLGGQEGLVQRAGWSTRSAWACMFRTTTRVQSKGQRVGSLRKGHIA